MILTLTDEQAELLALALGDAICYRVGDDSTEPDDHLFARRYDRLATELGIVPSDPAPYDDALADEAEGEETS